jgi:hypothetical protein
MSADAVLSRDIRQFARLSVSTFAVMLVCVWAGFYWPSAALYTAILSAILGMMLATFLWILGWSVMARARQRRELAAIMASWDQA